MLGMAAMSEAASAKSSDAPSIDGVFYRIVPAIDVARAFAGVRTAEGRFHHDGQPALYLSPTQDWAERAVDRYRRPADAPRVAVPLRVAGGAVVDLRSVAACVALAIEPVDLVAEWWRQRENGLPAASWRASDAVRAAGVDGIIYPSRTNPTRWHLALFRWNDAGGPAVAAAGPPMVVKAAGNDADGRPDARRPS